MDPIGRILDSALHWLYDNSGQEPTQLPGNDPITGDPPPESGLPTAYTASASGTFDADFTNGQLFPSTSHPDAGTSIPGANINIGDQSSFPGSLGTFGWSAPPLVEVPPDYPADAPVAEPDTTPVYYPDQSSTPASDPGDWQQYPGSNGNPDAGSTPGSSSPGNDAGAPDASDTHEGTDAGTGLDGGSGVAAGAGDAGGAGDAAGGACFVAGTPVLRGDGRFTAIDALCAGDLVMARHEVTGEMAPRRVTRVWSHENRPTLSVRLSDGTDVTTTREHRFASSEGRFSAIAEYAAGDHLATCDGALEISGIESERGHATVFNITVDEFHTYFVGTSKLWVHNEKTSFAEPDASDISGDD